MATHSVPFLSNGKFSGKASNDIDQRILASVTSAQKEISEKIAASISESETKMMRQLESKANLAAIDEKVQQAVQKAVKLAPPAESSASFIDNGDGTVTIR